MGALKTRQPTGLPPWPIVLLAGAEKVGKSYAAAEASASASIGRTFWVSVGEDDPDELGALPGARFEIVQHDGSYRGILEALTDAAAVSAEGAPNLIVLDSASRLWDLLTDMAQVQANARAKAKARKYNRDVTDEDAPIGMDLWNTAKERWQNLVGILRQHSGPSIVTARLEQTAVMNDRGEPTKEKIWKVKAEKSLSYDVGVVVEIPTRGKAFLSGVRSLRLKTNEDRIEYPGFTIEKLWADLGVTGVNATSPRHHTTNRPDAHPDRDYFGEAAATSSIEVIRELWDDARAAGHLTEELAETFTSRAAELGQEKSA